MHSHYSGILESVERGSWQDTSDWTVDCQTLMLYVGHEANMRLEKGWNSISWSYEHQMDRLKLYLHSFNCPKALHKVLCNNGLCVECCDMNYKERQRCRARSKGISHSVCGCVHAAETHLWLFQGFQDIRWTRFTVQYFKVVLMTEYLCSHVILVPRGWATTRISCGLWICDH